MRRSRVNAALCPACALPARGGAASVHLTSISIKVHEATSLRSVVCAAVLARQRAQRWRNSFGMCLMTGTYFVLTSCKVGKFPVVGVVVFCAGCGCGWERSSAAAVRARCVGRHLGQTSLYLSATVREHTRQEEKWWAAIHSGGTAPSRRPQRCSLTWPRRLSKLGKLPSELRPLPRQPATGQRWRTLFWCCGWASA